MVKAGIEKACPAGLASDVTLRLARQLVRLTVLSAQISTLDASAD